MKTRSFLRKRSSLLFVLLCLNAHVVLAQKEPLQFYDIIEDDSVVMYFNTINRFCKKECAHFKRYTRISAEGDFTGNFTDSSIDKHLLAKGHYKKGIKQGLFFIAIPTQSLYLEGGFQNNLPYGTWQYYYANGNKERKLVLSETDTLLVEFFDVKGEQLVKDGNGRFTGRVHVPGSRMDNRVIASGEVVNGKATGEWTSTISAAAYNRETLKDGQLLSGSTPNSSIRNSIKYADYSLITNFLLETHLEKLESLQIDELCGNPKRFPTQEKIVPLKLENFYSSLHQDAGKIVEEDIRNQKFDDYELGENRLTVKFKLNDKGIPIAVTRVSTWGEQFVQVVDRNLRAHTRFNLRSGELYFHMVIKRNSGRMLQYQFSFSASPDR